jgi:hypothetical protein
LTAINALLSFLLFIGATFNPTKEEPMQKSTAYQPRVTTIGLILASIFAIVVLMTVAANGQCNPNDLICLNLP